MSNVMSIVSMAKSPAKGAPNGHGSAVAPEAKTRTRTAQPPLYKVLLHNDDYTTMDFVVTVLRDIFHKSEAEATAIMLHVHHAGVGLAGVYTREIAESKVIEVTRAAEAAEFPLLCTMESADAESGSDHAEDGAGAGRGGARR